MESDVPRPRRKPGRPEHPVARGDLIRIARDLFAEHGFDGVSMADIAHAAGLQKSSLFHHFSTKESLYREVLDGALAEATEVLALGLSAESDNWEDRLDAMIAGVTRALAQPARAQLLVREYMSAIGNREAGESVQNVLALGVRFLEDGAAAGAWPKQDFRHVVMSNAGIHVLFFAMPHLTSRFFGGVDLTDPAVIDERVRIAVRHIRGLLGLPPR